MDETSDLSDYLTYAALNNPGLEAAFNRWRAALMRVPQVGSLPDPRLTYRYFISEVETRVGPQQQAVGLTQTFPWLGKLSLREDVAAEAASAARKLYDAEKLRLFYEVKDAYYEYYYLSRAIAVVMENRDLVRYLEGVARARYKTAAAAQPEVIRAQVELGKLEDNLRALEDLRGPVVARLNAAMNRPIEKDLPEPKVIHEVDIDVTDDQVLRWASRGNPQLAALDHEIAGQRNAIDLAKKDYFPDITLGIDYTDVGSPPRMSGPGLGNPAALRSLSRITGGMSDAIDLYTIGRSFQPSSRPDDAGKDVWLVSLSMNLPIRRGKYAAGEREARARYRAAVSTRAQHENTLGAQIKKVLYDFRDAKRKIDLYRDTLIPKARQNLSATEAAYRTGAATFLDLVDAERSLLEFELSYERALANHAQRLARLEMLVGQTIPRKDVSKHTEDTAPAPGADNDKGVTP
ncbi:MAG: TolC family protein [Phycisphaerales bacterium]|nr:MAG: TolC family protein [Phycisphaerales bacterium]